MICGSIASDRGRDGTGSEICDSRRFTFPERRKVFGRVPKGFVTGVIATCSHVLREFSIALTRGVKLMICLTDRNEREMTGRSEREMPGRSEREMTGRRLPNGPE